MRMRTHRSETATKGQAAERCDRSNAESSGTMTERKGGLEAMEYGSAVAGKLQGKYIVRYGRTCDLIYLVFSDDASDHGKGGGTALHIQCGLRIVQGDQLVVCNEEMYVPREGASQQEIDDFAWDEPNARYDETMKRFMEGPARKVLQAKVHAWGDIVLTCDDGAKICVYTTSTDDDNEQWRFMQDNERDIIRTPHMYLLSDAFPDGMTV